jgi:hypothetical protein
MDEYYYGALFGLPTKEKVRIEVSDGEESTEIIEYTIPAPEY